MLGKLVLKLVLAVILTLGISGTSRAQNKLSPEVLQLGPAPVLITGPSGLSGLERVLYPPTDGALGSQIPLFLAGTIHQNALVGTFQENRLQEALAQTGTGLVLAANNVDSPLFSFLSNPRSGYRIFQLVNGVEVPTAQITRNGQALIEGDVVVDVASAAQAILLINGSIQQPLATLLYGAGSSVQSVRQIADSARLVVQSYQVLSAANASMLSNSQTAIMTQSSDFLNPAVDGFLTMAPRLKVHVFKDANSFVEVSLLKPAPVSSARRNEGTTSNKVTGKPQARSPQVSLSEEATEPELLAERDNSPVVVTNEGEYVVLDAGKNFIADIYPGVAIYMGDGFYCDTPVFGVMAAYPIIAERFLRDPNPVRGMLKNAISNLSGTTCELLGFRPNGHRGIVKVYDPLGYIGELEYRYVSGGVLTGKKDTMEVTKRQMIARRSDLTIPYVEYYNETRKIDVRRDDIFNSLVESGTTETNYLIGKYTPERWPEHAPAKARAIAEGYPLALYDRANAWLEENGVTAKVIRGGKPNLSEAQIAVMSELVEDAIASRYLPAIKLGRIAAAAGANLGSVDDIMERRNLLPFGYTRPKPQPGVLPTTRQVKSAFVKGMIIERCNWIAQFFHKHAKRHGSQNALGPLYQKLTPGPRSCEVDTTETLGHKMVIGVRDLHALDCRIDGTGLNAVCSFYFRFRCTESFVPELRGGIITPCLVYNLAIASATVNLKLEDDEWILEEFVPTRFDLDRALSLYQ